MNCPKCRQRRLREKYVSAMNCRVDYCPKCRGIWFDAGELEKALPQAEPQLQIPRRAVRLKASCPRCSKPLYAFVYPETRVAIEMCKGCCGLWLDAGELKRIREAREQRPPVRESVQDAEIGGIKGTLIRLIDAAVEQLWY